MLTVNMRPPPADAKLISAKLKIIESPLLTNKATAVFLFL